METQRATWEGLQETRIALAFYGGVALAVYESGVALEFFRLVRGEGAYAALRPLIGKVEVDIITGSSAGGLNGAFLANALVNGGNMAKLMEVWREEGDIGKLLYPPGRQQPRALLDGDRFRQKIFEALLEKQTGGGALQPYLDLFITATNLDGDCVTIPTPRGAPLKTRTHRQVFHFAYRAPAHADEPGRNDFASTEDTGLLADAVRTTSSFPFAFEPVLVTREGLGRRACDLSAPAYHVDGGVLDNKPIDHAVQAIAARRADKQIQRLLFYIEPDPEHITPNPGTTAARCYSPWEVILKSVLTLPAYQSITSALRKIQQHNRVVEARKRTLAYYDDAAGRYRARGVLKDAKAPEQARERITRDSWADDQHRCLTFLPDSNRATALYRALEDGYLDLRLDNDVVEKEAQRAALQAALQALARLLGETARGPFYDVKRMLLDRLDLTYHQRMYRYLAQLVRELYPAAPGGTGTGTGDLPWQQAVTGILNGLKDFFYSQEELIRSRQRAEATLQTAEVDELMASLKHAVEELRRLPLGPDGRVAEHLSAQVASRLSGLARQLAQHSLLGQRKAFLEKLRETAWRKLQNDYLTLPAEVLALHRGDYQVEAGYWKVRDALDSFFQRDLILYPMMQSPELAAELQPVAFARISPADASAFMGQLSARQKLAGEQGLHFGGFMSEVWRGNDLTWGRLDAAEIILKHLWPPGADPAGRETLRKQLQIDIIREMRQLGMGISTSGRARDFEHLIGRQTLRDIPWSRKLNWIMRGAVTTLTMLRDTLQSSKLAPILKSMLQVITWVIWTLVGTYHLLQKPWLQFLLFLAGVSWLIYLLVHCST